MISDENSQYRVYEEGVMESSCDRVQNISLNVVLEDNNYILYILSEQYFGEEYGLPGRAYSITIESNIEGVFERVILEDVSREYEEAYDILALFAKNTVTPESAKFIMEDLMS